MRVPGALFALIVCMSGGVMATEAGQAARTSSASSTSHCLRTRNYLAVERSTGSLTPRKLTELPPATAYMAVYRQIGGCDAPLTMAKYRRPRRPQ